MRLHSFVAAIVGILMIGLSFGTAGAQDTERTFCFMKTQTVTYTVAEAFDLQILGLDQSNNTTIIIDNRYEDGACPEAPTSTSIPVSTATDVVAEPTSTTADMPTATSTVASDGGKVFVCKYVGTPGVDERLQTGNNPISVSVNAIPNYQGVGSYFADAQGRSYVLSVDARTGGGQEGEPGVDQCPPPDTGEVPTNTPAPTSTPVDTATTAPTETMVPTNTPEATPSPSATPEKTPVMKTPTVITDGCEAFGNCTPTPTQAPTEKPTTPPDNQDGGTATVAPSATVAPVDDSDGGNTGTTELPHTGSGSGYILPHKANTEKMMLDAIFFAAVTLLALVAGFWFLRWLSDRKSDQISG